MLKILTGEEVALKPLSDVDNRLQGDIALKNEFKDHYIVFKVLLMIYQSSNQLITPFLKPSHQKAS